MFHHNTEDKILINYTVFKTKTKEWDQEEWEETLDRILDKEWEYNDKIQDKEWKDNGKIQDKEWEDNGKIPDKVWEEMLEEIQDKDLDKVNNKEETLG